LALRLTPKQVQKLALHPAVEKIEPDGVIQISKCYRSPTRVYSWGLTRISNTNQTVLNGVYSFPSSGGKGVIVYVVDTGISISNVEFSYDRAQFGYKADPTWTDTDGNGHGTHVAGTIAGNNFGVARNATLVAVKVLDDGGSGSYSGIISGLDWILSQYKKTTKPTVINMSLGGPIYNPLNTAVSKLISSGITIVVAAGNENDDACQVSPASTPSAIVVGSTEDGVDDISDGLKFSDVRSDFSNYGNCVTLFAPGSGITSAWIGSDTAINTISGTSMASPHVAGVAALILGENPKVTPQQVKQQLQKTATQGIINLICDNPGSNTAQCNKSPNLILFNGCDNNLA